METQKIKTALISVSDKTGLVAFASELSKNGVKIISSGGTYKALQDAKIKCVKVEDITNFPEMLEGRLKTLHPNLHGGILAKRNKDHLAQITKHRIEPIDLVVVNLYPFRETVSKKNVKLEDAIENIDIGGPTLIRAAAKNHESVGVVVESAQYQKVLADLKSNGFSLSEKMKKELCVEAFLHTAVYDSMVSEFLREKYNYEKFPQKLPLGFEKVASLRYGENPHQKAEVYKNPLAAYAGVLGAKQLNGKELSFNNYLDSDAAIRLVREFSEPCATIIKHTNPCGIACAKNLKDAFSAAYECDSLSAFGGIIALNRKCDIETAKMITSFFNEVVIAPSFEKSALDELKKKQNLRVLELAEIEKQNSESGALDLRQVDGGMLVQERDTISDAEKWENKSGVKCSKEQMSSLEFAWIVAKNVKSNAIVIAKGTATVGIGGGLTSRVDSAQLALKKAGQRAQGAALASDAFFPFKDSIELAAGAGISAIVEPGGSVKDDEVIAEAKRRGISLFFTGARHFRH